LVCGLHGAVFGNRRQILPTDDSVHQRKPVDARTGAGRLELKRRALVREVFSIYRWMSRSPCSGRTPSIQQPHLRNIQIMARADAKTAVLADGLRYKSKVSGSPFAATTSFGAATMSCFMCGKHRARSMMGTRKVLGQVAGRVHRRARRSMRRWPTRPPDPRQLQPGARW
jgi:hypothetical protein